MLFLKEGNLYFNEVDIIKLWQRIDGIKSVYVYNIRKKYGLIINIIVIIFSNLRMKLSLNVIGILQLKFIKIK